MKKLVSALSILFVVVILVLSVIFYALKDFSLSACENKIYETYYSPEKLKKAVIFQRDCGATTGFSTQISIQDLNDKLQNEKGNIFIADGQPKNLVLKYNGCHKIRSLLITQII